jgi:SAM-dependent methyltransferase
MKFDLIEERVLRTVDPKDTMLHGGNMEQYFDVGLSGLRAVLLGLDLAKKPIVSIHRILDYASGFGRVSRWLTAAFPSATLTACDADKKSIDSLRSTLGIRNTYLADLQMKQTISGEPFDVIWMGSLITHLPECDTLRALRYMHKHLAEDGIFVGSMHGQLVVDRLRSRERDYGLKEPETARLLRRHDAFGYGFGAYDHDPDYGISTWTENKAIEMFDDARLRLIEYHPNLWGNHQDIFIVRQK